MTSLKLTGLALGLAALVAVGYQQAGEATSAAAAAQAQTSARLVNARTTMRSAASGLAGTFDGIMKSQQEPAWIGYTVPATSGEHHACDYINGIPSRSYLEGRENRTISTDERRRVALEASPQLVVLYRVRQASLHKVRVFSEDCEIDAGGLPVFWLTDVNPDQSVALLESVPTSARESDTQRRRELGERISADQALTALALHGTPAATRSLNALVGASHPLSIRKKAAFWLGASRGREGFETLRRLLSSGAEDEAFRRELVFPISTSQQPDAVDVLLKLAKEDPSRKVREQALFWVGQKAGAKAAKLLSDVVENDPDTELKKRAVFALSQLPKDEGIPRLIEVAKNNPNGEVRKQAMFWLGQSGDPRALSFFEDVLKK